MKIKRHILLTIVFIFILSTFSVSLYAEGGVFEGWDTGRNPFLGLNIGGFGWLYKYDNVYWYGTYENSYHYTRMTLELEVDFKVAGFFSIAPRLGTGGFDFFSFGSAFRFGFTNSRPHGLWIGPAIDFFIGGDHAGKKNAFKIAITGELGWRYTFNFGLSLAPYVRLGAHILETSGFMWGLGLNIGYSF
mgnify:CR=1 FL=1